MQYELESEKVIAFRPEIAKLLESNDAALMFQQLSHWSKYATKNDGWIYKSASEMFAETNVSERKQRKARDILVQQGWVEAEKKLANGSPTWHYRVLVRMVTKVLAGDLTSSTGILPGATGKNAGSITKNTHNINLSLVPAFDFEKEIDDDAVRIYKGWLIEMVLGASEWLRIPEGSRAEALNGATKRISLTPRRYKLINLRLKELGFDRCAKAVRNIAKSDHHRGINNTKWKATPEWLFNTREKTEEWAER